MLVVQQLLLVVIVQVAVVVDQVELVVLVVELVDLPETCNGLFRATEVDSSAEEAYDNAFEEAVTGGFGALRLRNEYEDEYDGESDEQRICIEPIYDADSSVYFDLNAKRQDKADAKRCFVITALTREDYEAEWGRHVGGGSRKGIPNKTTVAVRNAIVDAFERVGGADYLEQVARQEPKVFCVLLPLGFLTLIALDTLALSQLPLSLPEALCVMFLFLWTTVLFWRSLLS